MTKRKKISKCSAWKSSNRGLVLERKCTNGITHAVWHTGHDWGARVYRKAQFASQSFHRTKKAAKAAFGK